MNILEKLKYSSNLKNFINDNFQEIYDFFHNQTQIELYPYKKEIKQYLRQSRREIISLDCSSKINGDFIALLIESCEKLHLFMEFGLFYDYLSKCGYKLGDRLKASSYYCSGIKKFDDYNRQHSLILDLLQNAYRKEEESKEKLTTTYINFYLHMLHNFGEYNKPKIIYFKKNILSELENYIFLDKELINTIFYVDISDYKKAYNNSLKILNSYLYKNRLIFFKINNFLQSETNQYSQQLYQIKNPNFDKIRKISIDYIISIGNPNYLHYQLNNGMTIIEEENLLYKYLLDYGKMHKAKLYSSFDTVIDQLNNKTINIIDWGCGQALATSLLMDYIKEYELNIDISNITLIEPSSLALSRGMLHIDVLKEKFITIKAINKDIDSLELNDLIIDNSNVTLHLFSNILDVEFFRLDREFLEKLSSSQKRLNYFICVSPNINDKRNARLDMFYRYFNNNFKTDLISNRDSSLGSYTRYERIFKTLI